MDTGVLLVIIFVVIMVGALANKLSVGAKEADRMSNPPCELHKWVYRDDANGGQFMVCEICSQLPGAANEADSDPYY